MIRFSLFNVPVSISSTLWVMLALVGGCLVAPELGLAGVALFVLAAFLCLLLHELGHALVGRWLAGGDPRIIMACLGCDCCNETARFTRTQGVLMTLAGPVVSLLVALVPVVLVCSGAEGCPVLELSASMVLGRPPVELMPGYNPALLHFMAMVTQISLWWSVLNLLPVFPLDGGLLMHGLMRSPRLMHRLSFFFALALALAFVCAGTWKMALLMAFLGAFNFRCQISGADT